MALFEFEDGHLVPAQFGYPVAQDLGPELVDAICQQVLQIVSRPLFPVTWRDMTGQGDEETPRLTALDVSGQIVSVEILKELDSETLITSLSRLAEVASISWSDLAGEYPSGPEGFRVGWAQFRDSMPPAVGPGPRLIIVAGASTGTVIRGLIAILARPLIGELGLSGRFTRAVVTSGQLGQLLVGPGLQVLRSGGEEGRELLPMRPVVLRFHRPRPCIIPLRRSSLRDCARSRPLPRPRHLSPLGMCCSGTAGPTPLLTSTPRSASWPERAQSVAWLRMEIE